MAQAYREKTAGTYEGCITRIFCQHCRITCDSAMLAFFIGLAQASSVMDGMRIGFFAWLGFVATSTLAAYVFEGRPIKLYVLYNTYQLVAFLVMGAILGA